MKNSGARVILLAPSILKECVMDEGGIVQPKGDINKAFRLTFESRQYNKTHYLKGRKKSEFGSNFSRASLWCIVELFVPTLCFRVPNVQKGKRHTSRHIYFIQYKLI